MRGRRVRSAITGTISSIKPGAILTGLPPFATSPRRLRKSPSSALGPTQLERPDPVFGVFAQPGGRSRLPSEFLRPHLSRRPSPPSSQVPRDLTSRQSAPPPVIGCPRNLRPMGMMYPGRLNQRAGEEGGRRPHDACARGQQREVRGARRAGPQVLPVITSPCMRVPRRKRTPERRRLQTPCGHS